MRELVRVDAGNVEQRVPLLRADVVLVPNGLIDWLQFMLICLINTVLPGIYDTLGD